MSEAEIRDPQVRWLTEPEMEAWRGLVRSTTGLLATLDNELQTEHGLSLGDYEVLVHLSEEPDHALRMSDLAVRLHLSPSGITRRLDGMVKVGLVERQPCQTTAAARAVAAAARVEGPPYRAHRARRAECFIDRLSDRQLPVGGRAVVDRCRRGTRGRRLRRRRALKAARSTTWPASCARRHGFPMARGWV